MQPVKSRNAIDQQTRLARSMWKKIAVLLEAERDRLHEEIARYPTPIPRCDAQFNHLIEERSRISAELEHARQSASDLAPGAPLEPVGEFIAASRCIGDAAKRELQSSLEEGVAGQNA